MAEENQLEEEEEEKPDEDAPDLDPSRWNIGFGTECLELQFYLLQQTAESQWVFDTETKGEIRDRGTAARAVLEAIEPRDEVEGMLAVQMFATHNAAMECFRRAMIAKQTIKARDQNLKHASKFLGIYARQLEVLDRRRVRYPQRSRAGYVDAQPRRQTIVGDVEGSSKTAKKGKSQAKRAQCQDPEIPSKTRRNSCEDLTAKPDKSGDVG